MWSSKYDDHVDIGVELFTPADTFRARMVEQICFIKKYKKDVFEKEGGEQTDNEAAQEWVDTYARNFPR